MRSIVTGTLLFADFSQVWDCLRREDCRIQNVVVTTE